MLNFPKGFFTDVRAENLCETRICYANGKIESSKEKEENGAFIRVYDGKRWYYSSVTDIKNIEGDIKKLSKYGTPCSNIEENPLVKKFQANKGNYIKFEEKSVSKIPVQEKKNLLQSLFPVLESCKYLKMWQAQYIDERKMKHIISSKGTDITFDTQRCGLAINLSFADGDKKFKDMFLVCSSYFEDLTNKKDELSKYIEKCVDFLQNSKPVKPGKATVILSPMASGIFAHESFGHKSEADFMVGDETMRKEWTIGKKVGAPILSIVDDGNELGSGYTPFDDEGTKAKKTFLIKDGLLAGRLHSSATAESLSEELTGNARAINYEYEPIVRMTTTYILPGNKTLDELVSGVKDGYFIDTISHGSGMSTFTLAPLISYRIRNGKIAEPVQISVISGTVFETLSNIDGVSDKIELMSPVTGGCGKGEQYPLPVGFGGPYVRIKNMNVQ